jgi:hypothetical protein
MTTIAVIGVATTTTIRDNARAHDRDDIAMGVADATTTIAGRRTCPWW